MATMTPDTIRPQSRPRPIRLAMVWTAVLLASAAIVSWPAGGAPRATWRFGPDRSTVQPFDPVPAFDAMTLEIDLPFAGFVYVVSFDHAKGSVCYFPTEFLGTDHLDADGRMNGFAAGTHELPGPWDAKPQNWFVPRAEGALSLCVVVSRAPIPDLEQTLTLTRQVGNRAFPSRTMGDYMPRAGRDKRVGRRRLPHPVLLAAQNQLGSVQAGPMVPMDGREDVFVKVLNIRPQKPRPGVRPPANPVQSKLGSFVKGEAGGDAETATPRRR